MTFSEAITAGFNGYVDFAGRTVRSGYWWWALFSAIVSVVAQILDSIIGVGLIQAITGLGLLLPGLAVGCRRMHDVDKSGWNLLWSLTIVGIIYVIYLAVQPGTPGPNKYGDDPMTSSAGI